MSFGLSNCWSLPRQNYGRTLRGRRTALSASQLRQNHKISTKLVLLELVIKPPLGKRDTLRSQMMPKNLRFEHYWLVYAQYEFWVVELLVGQTTAEHCAAEGRSEISCINAKIRGGRVYRYRNQRRRGMLLTVSAAERQYRYRRGILYRYQHHAKQNLCTNSHPPTTLPSSQFAIGVCISFICSSNRSLLSLPPFLPTLTDVLILK